MDEVAFEQFLDADKGITSKKAVSTRMSKARAVEKIFGSLDRIVSSDAEMLRVLLAINNKMNNVKGGYSNALRKYYTFKNGRIFPKIDAYDFENSK